MTNRNFNWRPNWLTATLGAAMGMVIAGAVVLAPMPVRAVHDDTNTPFELDGDPTDETTLDDWDSVFDLDPSPYPTTRDEPNDLESEGEVFVNDALENADGEDLTAFIQSNKDVHEVNTWSYDASGISPPKNDITSAYAKAYRVDHDNDGGDDPGDTPEHLIVYFGSDRFADDGDAAMGYWFFKNDVGLGPNNKFTGTHAVGDILIQIDYRGAGDNEIEVFKWVGSGGNAGQGKLQRLAIGTSPNPADTICTAANPGTGVPADAACITTNIVDIDSPWPYVAKGEDFVGNDRFPARSFMEGGFDVTALIGEVCFSAFMAETRTSHSETASLKDFALGDFDLCSINIEKECVNNSAVVDPINETFTTTHLVTITNDGFGGSLKDVELSDTRTSAINTCKIISVVEDQPGDATGLAGVNFVFDAASDSVEVADTLKGTIVVELECLSRPNGAIPAANPFVNEAAVKARATAGAPQDITDVDPEDPGDTTLACQADLNVGLVLKKWCQGDDGVGNANGLNPYFGVPDDENPLGLSVFLKPPTYAPEVCVDIELSNPSEDQKMVIDTFTDSDLGNLLPAGGLTLNPDGQLNDSYVVSRCYTPTAPDGASGSPIDPTHAAYSDTVNATAHGKIDNATASAGPVTATCELCPPHD